MNKKARTFLDEKKKNVNLTTIKIQPFETI